MRKKKIDRDDAVTDSALLCPPEYIFFRKHKPLLETSTEIPADFEFNDEFSHAFDLMENSNRNLFITGKAGTGKSTLLQYFRKNTEKNIVVLAPTGVAAVKIRGQTIHSFFRFPPKAIQKKHVRRLKNKAVINNLDAIVIDEVSMLRADILDGIDHSLRINRDNHNEVFGGVQIIVLGDLFQLPPVVGRQERQVLEAQYESPYFFSAPVWQESKLLICELNKVYRQKDDAFIDILNRVRMGQCDEYDLEKINKRVVKNIVHDEQGIITLTTTNSAAKAINSSCLKKINSQEISFESFIKGDFDARLYPTDVTLKLKVGAQVMLLKNDKEKRWVNGTLAEVSSVGPANIEVNINGEYYQMVKEKWEKIEYYFNKEENTIDEKILGYFEQFPLMLAWAVTIHKSQGQNFEDLIIDIGYGAFAHGQTYVALSRCTKLEGIKLARPIALSDIIFDKRIYKFMKNHT